MSQNLNQWSSVPANARFELSIRGKTGGDVNFVANARVIPTVGRDENWFDGQLNPGPETLRTDANVSYAIRVAVKFFGTNSETAVVEARVLDAQGKAVTDWWGEKSYTHSISGKIGDPPGRLTLILIDD